MIATSQYYKVTARVGVPHRYEVEVTVPLVGPAGATGATGATGANGQGVPAGGTTGQVLRKASGTNYDTEWAAAASGSGSVTSVALAGTGLSISGSPVTTSGTITANVSYGTTAGTAAQGNDSRFVTASTTTPAALGTAAVGVGTTFARADHVHAMPTAAAVGAAKAVTEIELVPDGTTTITTAQLPARGIAFSDGETTFTINLPTPDIRQSGLTFSVKSEYEAGSGPNFIVVVHNATTLLNTELDEAAESIDFLWDGFAWTYSNTNLLRSFPGRVLLMPAESGTIALVNQTDTNFRVVGSADATKRLAFEVDGLSTATTRTLTIPNRSGTMVVSDTSAGTGSDVVNNIVSLTQAEYNAIGSPDATTLYLITDP